MTITVNNPQNTTGIQTTLNYTPSSVSNSVLVVAVFSEDVNNNSPITDVTWNSVSMTLAASALSVSGAHSNDCEIWYVASPGTVAHDIVMSGGERQGVAALTLGSDVGALTLDAASAATTGNSLTSLSHTLTPNNPNGIFISAALHGTSDDIEPVEAGQTSQLHFDPSGGNQAMVTSDPYTSIAAIPNGWRDVDEDTTLFRLGLATAIFYEPAASGRIMSSLAHRGGLAGAGGIAGQGGGLAG